MDAWIDSIDKFIREQSKASKAAALLNPFRYCTAVDQKRLCRTFRGAVGREQMNDGYCFALTALWLHESAHGRADALMQKLRTFNRARCFATPGKRRREQLRELMEHMHTLNNRQFFGAHALDNTSLQPQKVVIAHIDADALVDVMIRNLEKYALWDVSSANHTIGVNFTRGKCVVYDPNDPDGVFEATRDDRAHLVAYLRSALRFPEGINEQPLTLTAFAQTPAAATPGTHVAGVSQDNVNTVAPAGQSVAEMTLRFMSPRAALALVNTYHVSMPERRVREVADLIAVDMTYVDVLAGLLRGAHHVSIVTSKKP